MPTAPISIALIELLGAPLGCASSRAKAANVIVGGDRASVGAGAAKLIQRTADKAIAARGEFTVAFSGGSLPKIVGSALTKLELKNVDKWKIFFSDERCVKTDSKDSNYLGVKDNVLDPLKIKPEQVYTIDNKLVEDPKAAAQNYEKRLREAFKGQGVPSFDLILLGMGPDGHTCSLFPGHALLGESKRLVAEITDSPKQPPNRITLTYPVLNVARAIAFVCCGGSKSDALRQILTPGTSCDLPSGRIRNDNVTWFVDAEAAGDLDESKVQVCKL